MIPGSQVAVQHINSRCDILEDYELKLQVNDSGCNIISKATISTIENLFHRPNERVIGIIGPGCSEAAIVIGKLVAHDSVSLLNIAPSATSPALVNVTEFPNTFRPVVSSLGFIDMYADFVQLKNFISVCILYEAERPFHIETANKFQKRLQQSNVTFSSFGMIQTFIPLHDIMNKYRIIFVFAGGGLSSKLMCLAFHEKMLYPTYQFIFNDRRLNHFVKEVSLNHAGIILKCNKEVMQRATVGIILNLVRLTRKDQNKTLESGMNYTQFYEDYQATLELYKQELNLSNVVATEHQSGYYDSTWALALSLDASIPRLEAELNKSLSDYKWGEKNMTEIIRSELLEVNFEGIRGRVQFSNRTLDGKNVTVIDMFQVQMKGYVKEVAVYNPIYSEGSKLLVFDPLNKSIFIDDEFNEEIISPPLYVEIIVFITISITTLSTVIFHILNSLWTSAKSMKVTSPSLNHLIFSGCYLYILSILFKSLQLLPETHHPVFFGVRCSSFIWCESIALTLIFTTICVKTWRVFRIFSHASAKVITDLNDTRLILYVCAVLLIDVVFNVVWNTINPWSRYRVAFDQLRVRVVCNCDNIIVWLSCLLTQKALLTFVVLYLSIITRRIPKREYKQTKSTNALVYSLIFLYFFTIPLHLILLSKTSVSLVTVSYIALCVKNIMCVVLCTVFIFLPPVLPILRSKWKACWIQHQE